MGGYFLAGVISLAFLVVALFFFKFWWKSRESFFLMFSLAFLLLGMERILIAFFVGRTTVSYVYVVRLVAFLLIIVAFIRKNRK
jgi:hypothetical protein